MARPLLLLVALAAACDSSSGMTGADAAGPPPDGGPPAHLVAYVSGYGPDIAWYDLDHESGALTMAGKIAAFAPSPSFLAIRSSEGVSTHLYAVSESNSRVGAYAIDPRTGALTFINDVPTGGDGPAHVSVDRSGQYVFVANYGDGAVSVFPIRADGGVAPASQTLNAGANAHQIVADPSNKHVLVPCKGADYIAAYDLSAGALMPSSPAQVMTGGGAGPRHVAWGRLAENLYLVNENDSTLVAFDYQLPPRGGGHVSPLQTVSTRASDATGDNTGAEVVVDEGNEIVYVSNRGDDNIAVFQGRTTRALPALTLLGHVPTGGQTPRMIALEGRWLFAANQGSNTVTTFRIDPSTHLPAPVGTPLSVSSPSFIGFARLSPP